MAFTRGLDGATLRKLYDHGGPERMLDLTLRTGPFGDRYGENPGGLTLDMLKANPNGIDFGPMVSQLPDVLGTPDKKIRLAPPYLLDDLSRLAARMERPAEPLVLVSRRHLRSNNTWMHNVPALMKGKDRCTLLIHPDDAARCGVADDDVVTVKSAAGEITVPVEITERDQTRRGVDATRLGTRQAWNPYVGGEQFTGRKHECAFPADVYR